MVAWSGPVWEDERPWEIAFSLLCRWERLRERPRYRQQQAERDISKEPGIRLLQRQGGRDYRAASLESLANRHLLPSWPQSLSLEPVSGGEHPAREPRKELLWVPCVVPRHLTLNTSGQGAVGADLGMGSDWHAGGCADQLSFF